MKNIFLALFSITFLAVSCKKDEKPTYIKDENGVAQQQSAPLNNEPTASLMSQAGVASSAAPQGMQQISAPPGMLNPEHGQPGHRCDIAVGQPLNGTPTQAATSSNQNINVNAGQTVNINPSAVSPGKIAVDSNGKTAPTAPGMNPPHGQPGHRCDIPVGESLSSKPASQPAQNMQVQAPQPAPVSQPVVANTGPKPKNNPAHGQPWHDCAKQVGAPL